MPPFPAQYRIDLTNNLNISLSNDSPMPGMRIVVYTVCYGERDYRNTVYSGTLHSTKILSVNFFAVIQYHFDRKSGKCTLELLT